MVDLNMLFTVSFIWAIAAITPGPNFFITVHTAVSTDRRLSLFTVLGIVTGTLIWSLSGYLGISIIFKTVPTLYYSLKIIGGLYLISVGCNLLINRKRETKTGTENHRSAIACFRLGLLTNLLNPKTAAFITSLFAVTIPAGASIESGVLCVAIICLISAMWYSIVAAVFSYQPAKLMYEKQKRRIEKIAGAIFIVFGLKLSVSK